MLRFALVLLALLMPVLARAELRGHGGPVRALAVSSDGRIALSGSFDESAILWDLDRGAALLALALLQMGVGIVTLLFSVPLHAALCHQALAMVLLGATVRNRRLLSDQTPR